ncbi:MAG: hypothetical protein ACTSU5_10525 [Promethearchaeota archaeon]
MSPRWSWHKRDESEVRLVQEELDKLLSKSGAKLVGFFGVDGLVKGHSLLSAGASEDDVARIAGRIADLNGRIRAFLGDGTLAEGPGDFDRAEFQWGDEKFVFLKVSEHVSFGAAGSNESLRPLEKWLLKKLTHLRVLFPH